MDLPAHPIPSMHISLTSCARAPARPRAPAPAHQKGWTDPARDRTGRDRAGGRGVGGRRGWDPLSDRLPPTPPHPPPPHPPHALARQPAPVPPGVWEWRWRGCLGLSFFFLFFLLVFFLYLSLLAWVCVRRGACEMGMPEHGGPQAAAFARACKSSPPPSLFNLPSQARAFFFIVCFYSSPEDGAGGAHRAFVSRRRRRSGEGRVHWRGGRLCIKCPPFWACAGGCDGIKSRGRE